MAIVLDKETMALIGLFSRISGTNVHDCITRQENIIFIVEPGEMGKAIGKNGANVREFEHKLHKRIKIFEYSIDLSQLIKNMIYPLEIVKIEENDGIVFLTAKDLKTRGLLIGRGAIHLRMFESIVKRYFPIKELKVE